MMTNDLQQIGDLLLKNRLGREDWGGDISQKKAANTFLICCLVNYQWRSGVAWKKGEHLVKLLDAGENVWVKISSFRKETWDSKYEEYGKPSRFRSARRGQSWLNEPNTKRRGALLGQSSPWPKSHMPPRNNARSAPSFSLSF